MLFPCILIEIASVLRLWLSFSILNQRIFFVGFYLAHSAAIVFLLRALILSQRSMMHGVPGEISLESRLSHVYISSLAIALIPKFIFLCVLGPAINANTTSR